MVSAATGVLSGVTGQNISITATTDPSNGTVVVNADGSYRYTPDAGYVGPDSFTYTVTDAQDRTATGTVTISVEAPTPPTAPKYTESTPFDTELTVAAAQGLLSQATGTGITLTSSTAAAHGTVVVNPDGSYTYTPDAGYAGPDSFTYTVTDADAQTATGTVTISVEAPTPPTAPKYTESTPFDTELTVAAAQGLLSQATGTGITLTSSTAAAHGTVVVNPDGSYTYTPDAGYAGPDSFTYTVTDADAQTATGTVTVHVGTTAAPTAADYTESTPFDTELTVAAAQGLLSQATGTGITLTSSTAAAHGTVVVNPDGSYTYTPDAGYAGPDSFTYTVTDADAQTATGTVTVHVGTPAAPTAADYSESTSFDTPLSVSASNGLGSLDTGTALTYALSTSPSHGQRWSTATGPIRTRPMPHSRAPTLSPTPRPTPTVRQRPGRSPCRLAVPPLRRRPATRSTHSRVETAWSLSTVVSSITGVCPSWAPLAARKSPLPSWTWRPPRTAGATGSSAAMGGSLPSVMPRSWDRSVVSR